MLMILNKEDITNESIQKIILGVALILKNNGVEKISEEKIYKIVANKLEEDLLRELMDALNFTTKEKIIKIINELLELEKNDLVKEIIKWGRN